jgi:hypothetical protein
MRLSCKRDVLRSRPRDMLLSCYHRGAYRAKPSAPDSAGAKGRSRGHRAGRTGALTDYRECEGVAATGSPAKPPECRDPPMGGHGSGGRGPNTGRGRAVAPQVADGSREATGRRLRLRLCAEPRPERAAPSRKRPELAPIALDHARVRPSPGLPPGRGALPGVSHVLRRPAAGRVAGVGAGMGEERPGGCAAGDRELSHGALDHAGNRLVGEAPPPARASPSHRAPRLSFSEVEHTSLVAWRHVVQRTSDILPLRGRAHQARRCFADPFT